MRPDGLPGEGHAPTRTSKFVSWGILLLIRDSVSSLVRQIVPGSVSEYLPLTQRLIRAHRESRNGDPSSGDIQAWENSLPVVLGVLHDLGLHRVEVMIEFALPHTSSALDLLVAGELPGRNEFSYVAVELKQVRKASIHPECSIAVDLGYSQYKLHPVRQVQRYCEFMARYLVPLYRNPQQLVGAAFLHNASPESVKTLAELPESDYGRLYTSHELEPFRTLLKARIADAPGGEAAQALIKAKRAPLEKITEISRSRPVEKGGLVLLDEQELAFDRVSRTVQGLLEEAEHAPMKKRVFIIRGGPGSGKSAVALKLREQLSAYGHTARLASGSSAYTKTLREIMVNEAPRGEVLKRRKESVLAYPYFNSFMEAQPDGVDVLICDEAHRIRRTSTDRYTRRELRENETPQADELMRAARVPVFLLDDHQSLRPEEVGDAAYLQKRAKELGYEADLVELGGQFRGGGSAQYQRWVQRLLGIDGYDPEPWRPDGRSQLLVAESPEELEGFVRARQAELGGWGSARITAGFCWKWRSPEGEELPDDVVIGDWMRPWNSKAKKNLTGAPSSALWATDPRGIDQIGCVYTAQTFEYDWSGVILGPDLLWRRGRFTVDRDATCDPELTKKVSDEVVNRCVRNAYHVLLTRGVAGTIVHSTDPETQDALRRFITGSVSRAPARKGVPGHPLTAEGNPVPQPYRGK